MKRVAFLLLLLVGSTAVATVDDAYLQRVNELEDTIARIEADRDPFHLDLFEPLMQLARTQLDAGEVAAALDLFQRAQHISHRNEGVYTPRQLGIIRQMTNLALQQGEFEEADRQQAFSFFVQQHHLAEDDPQLITAYTSMADWYMFTGQPRKARRILEEALDIAVAAGHNELPLLTRIHKTRRLEGICCRTRDLEEHLQARSDADPDSLAAAYIELADAHILSGNPEEAAAFYRRAHDVSPLSVPLEPRAISAKRKLLDPRFRHNKVYKLDRHTYGRIVPEPRRMFETDLLDDDMLEPQWFIVDGDNEHVGFAHPDSRSTENRHEDPQPLVGSPLLFSEQQLDNLLSRRVRSRREELTIEMSFDVMADGNLENIEIVDSNAPHKLERLVMSAMKKVHYRPAIQEGIPVDSYNVRLRQTFKPLVRELDA